MRHLGRTHGICIASLHELWKAGKFVLPEQRMMKKAGTLVPPRLRMMKTRVPPRLCLMQA